MTLVQVKWRLGPWLVEVSNLSLSLRPGFGFSSQLLTRHVRLEGRRDAKPSGRERGVTCNPGGGCGGGGGG